jgi:Protein of unknown function (DUF3631)
MSHTAADVTKIRNALACDRSGCTCHQRTGNVHCLTHEDANPSLNVSLKDGKVLVHCYGGCEQDAIVAALKDRKLWPSTIVAEYDYHDENGTLLYQVVRLDPKDFRQRRPNGHNDWVWKLDGVRRVPYRLPRLRSDPDKWRLILEGEKDCDLAVAAGWIATTNAGGAGKWRPENAEHFRGLCVALIPDNDQPGYKHMCDVYQSLDGVAAEIRIIHLQSAKDLSDYIAAGGSLDDVEAVLSGEMLPDLESIDAAELARLAGVADVAVSQAEDSSPIDGAQLLDDVLAFLRTFVIYPSTHAHVAHALWIQHTHLMDAWESTPRIAFLSPEPASGKTRALEITELITPNPVEAINVSAAYLFRKVDSDDGRPTILFDEVDTVFGPKAKEHEDVRGLLNAGHRKGAIAGRCVMRGKNVELVDYPAYCAVALAGLGDLPDTILTRSIVIRMRRRAPNESVTPYRRRVNAAAGHALRDQLARWAKSIEATVTDAWPQMPDGIEDRHADVWEALLAIADAAGGNWPERARAAAIAFVSESRESTPSLGIRLLTDIRAIFDKDKAEQLATQALLDALIALEEAPWAELVAGKPLNARGLAKRLTVYGVKSKNLALGGQRPKGYRREDFTDAWMRYLPVPPSPTQPLPEGDTRPYGEKSATAATAATDHEQLAQSWLADAFDEDEEDDEVADVAGSNAKVADTNGFATHEVADVAAVADFRWDRESVDDCQQKANEAQLALLRRKWAAEVRS